MTTGPDRWKEPMMRKISIASFLMLLLLAPLAAEAAHFADFYILPTAAHTSGLNGTFFRTDVSVQNFQTSTLTVNLFLLESGEGNSENLIDLVSDVLPAGLATVPPGGSIQLKDVLKGFKGKTDGVLGAILISGNLPFAVVGRVYTSSATGGSFGQSVQPVRDFLDNTIGDTNNAMAVSYLPGLISNAAFRTNLGMVAGSAGSGMTVEITLKGADGSTLGTRSFVIPPGSFRHLQFNANTIRSTFELAGAEYRITAGDGAVTPYATVIDSVTGDSVFVTGVFPPNAPFAKTGDLFRQAVRFPSFR